MDWYHQQQVPIDVLAEILVRLPVKSLLRFQCVSKTWRSLILDPSFVQSHRLRSQQKPLFLIVNDWWMQNDTFTIYSLTDKAMLGECFNSPEETLVEYFKSPDISCDAVMITSSPDLLLFRQDIRGVCSGCFFLLNPSTGERLILPESHNFKGCCSFGLDYVPSLGRFKVARFFPGAKAKARTGCEVLVVGVDRSWRPTEDSPLTLNCCTHGAPLLNGVIHMLSSFLDQGIAAFDLRREIWRVIQLPPGFCFRGNSWVPQEQTDLRELKGSLYLSRFTLMKLETWVLKDYENGNWTMQYNIDILQLWRMCWYDIECHTKVYPLMIKDEGKILMAVSTTRGVFHYDTEKKVFTVLGYIPEPFVYAENYLPLT